MKTRKKMTTIDSLAMCALMTGMAGAAFAAFSAMFFDILVSEERVDVIIGVASLGLLGLALFYMHSTSKWLKKARRRDEWLTRIEKEIGIIPPGNRARVETMGCRGGHGWNDEVREKILRQFSKGDVTDDQLERDPFRKENVTNDD